MWRFTDPERTPTPGEPIDPKDIEVLMVHRPRYRDWSWPKGKAEANEPILIAAVREVEEETGLAVALGAPLTTQRYRLGSGQTKEVRYWVGTVLPEDPRLPASAALRTRTPVRPATSAEIDRTRWASPQRAEDMLTRKGDRRLLSELVSRAREGALVTSTIAIVRHGKALSRSAWSEDEPSRPLTRLGARQAIDLVGIFSALGIESALSSPWRRCVQTLSPWSQLGGVEIAARDELTEWAVHSAPERAASIVDDLVASPCAPTVMCVHRPSVPTLLEPLRSVSPSVLLRAFPDDSPWLATADLLVAHISRAEGAPALVALERHGTRTKAVLGLN